MQCFGRKVQLQVFENRGQGLSEFYEILRDMEKESFFVTVV